MPAPRRRSMERWRGWPRDLWDPFGEFPQLWNRMAQMFESGGGPDTWMPTVETEDTSDAYEVRAELPGMKSDDVNVEMRGNELRITGEVTEKENGEGKPLRQRQGKFAYRTTVPADADAAKVDAELADGILTVRLPKAPQAQARQIQVKG
jgi:HSP20 family protein